MCVTPYRQYMRKEFHIILLGKIVYVCILPLGSCACTRFSDNSSLVYLENGVRERSKEKKRFVVENFGR